LTVGYCYSIRSERKLCEEVRFKSHRDDGTFSRADFHYDGARDVYICPTGKTLTTTGRMKNGMTLYYRATKPDCDPCPFKTKCCPKSPECRVTV
jgi:hypothetical protein